MTSRRRRPQAGREARFNFDRAEFHDTPLEAGAPRREPRRPAGRPAGSTVTRQSSPGPEVKATRQNSSASHARGKARRRPAARRRGAARSAPWAAGCGRRRA